MSALPRAAVTARDPGRAKGARNRSTISRWMQALSPNAVPRSDSKQELGHTVGFRYENRVQPIGFVRTDAEEPPDTGAFPTWRERWSSTRNTLRNLEISELASAYSRSSPSTGA